MLLRLLFCHELEGLYLVGLERIVIIAAKLLQLFFLSMTIQELLPPLSPRVMAQWNKA
jgi:hypothetical protein